MELAWKILGAALCACAFSACASLREIYPDEDRAIRYSAGVLAGGIAGGNSVEREILEDGAYCCLSSFARRDPSFVREHLPGLKNAADFQRYTLRAFGETTLEYGLDMAMGWDAGSRFDYGNPKKARSVHMTPHFSLFFYPHTRAADDVDKIASLARGLQ